MSLTDGYLEPIGRCENCGRYVLEIELRETLMQVTACCQCWPDLHGKLEPVTGS